MHADDDEITNPGTPDALRTMREIQKAVTQMYARLGSICDALDRIEAEQRNEKRETRIARADASRALALAGEAGHKARFSDKRIDSLVQRVQGIENGGR